MPELNFLWLLLPLYLGYKTRAEGTAILAILVIFLLFLQYLFPWEGGKARLISVGNYGLILYAVFVLIEEKENITQDMWVAGILLLTSLAVFFI